MKAYSEKNIEMFLKSILEDEFDDKQQNEKMYEGDRSGQDVLNLLISLGGLSHPVLDIGAGCGSDKSDMSLEPNEARAGEKNVISGWFENTELESLSIGTIICWGTMCFVRSVPECLIEANRILRFGGSFIFDVVEYSTMPLAQTVNPKSFRNYVELFGFSLQTVWEFGFYYHKRVGYRYKKVREFLPVYLRMPQSKGEINNFLYSRDWYMR